MTVPSAPVRVVLVSANEVVRRGLHHILELSDETTVVGEAASALAAVDEAARADVDVIVIDVRRLPDEATVAGTRKIRSANRAAKVLFLVTHVNAKTLLSTVIAGASGYVVKDLDPAGIRQAIVNVSRGVSLFEPRLGDRALEHARRELAGHWGSAPLALTDGEDSILNLIGQGFVNHEIADRLSLSEQAVERLISGIYGTLHFGGD